MISCEARQQAVSTSRGRAGSVINRDLSPGVSALWIKPSAIRSCPWPSIMPLRGCKAPLKAVLMEGTWDHSSLETTVLQSDSHNTTSKTQVGEQLSQLLCEMALRAIHYSSAAAALTAFFWYLNSYVIKRRSTENDHCSPNELKRLHYGAVIEDTSSPPLKQLWLH